MLSKDFKKIFFGLKNIILPNFGRAYLTTAFLSLISAFLELLGVSLMLSVLLLIFDNNSFADSDLLTIVKVIFNIQEREYVVLLFSAALFLIYLLKNVAILSINRKQIDFSFKVAKHISSSRYIQMLQSGLLFFKKKKYGDVVNELIGAGINLPDALIIPSLIVVGELSLILIITLALIIYNPFLFLFAAVIVVPSVYVLLKVNRKKLNESGHNLHYSMPKIYENVSNISQGFATITLWNLQKKYLESFENQRLKIFESKKTIQIHTNFIPVRIYETIAVFGIFSIVLVSSIIGTSTNIASILTVYAAVAFRILPSINRVIGSYSTLVSYIYLFDYFKQPISMATMPKTLPPAVKSLETINLESISFTFPDNFSSFHGVNLCFKAGQLIGIYGPSGGGKTTFLHILSSLYHPTEGVLKWNGEIVDNSNLHDYRYMFSYVTQDVFLVSGTILENIVFGVNDSKVDHYKLNEVLLKSNLKPWLDTLKNGLETNVLELGNNISGGQKQRLAIARALYKDTMVFIFDEISNNLDEESKKVVQESIISAKNSGKLVVVVSHHQEELEICDRILCVKEGRVSEELLI